MRRFLSTKKEPPLNLKLKSYSLKFITESHLLPRLRPKENTHLDIVLTEIDFDDIINLDKNPSNYPRS